MASKPCICRGTEACQAGPSGASCLTLPTGTVYCTRVIVFRDFAGQLKVTMAEEAQEPRPLALCQLSVLIDRRWTLVCLYHYGGSVSRKLEELHYLEAKLRGFCFPALFPLGITVLTDRPFSGTQKDKAGGELPQMAYFPVVHVSGSWCVVACV